MCGVLSHRSHVVEVKCDVLPEHQAVPDDRMVNVATERGWIPIQRNRSCDLRGSLILEAHDWRPVARTYARRKVAVAGLVGVQS